MQNFLQSKLPVFFDFPHCETPNRVPRWNIPRLLLIRLQGIARGDSFPLKSKTSLLRREWNALQVQEK
jgi:hypothetical protein